MTIELEKHVETDYQSNNSEKPEIKPFLQNTLNPSEMEKYKGIFVSGWTSRYNTIQTSVSKKD